MGLLMSVLGGSCGRNSMTALAKIYRCPLRPESDSQCPRVGDSLLLRGVINALLLRHVELWEQRDSTNAAVAECIAFAFSRRLIEPSAPITNSASAFVRPRTLVLGICRAGCVPAPVADK